MKSLILSCLMIMTANYAQACLDAELKDIANINEIENQATLLPKAGLKMVDSMRKTINTVIDISGPHCPNSSFTTASFVTKSGKLFHAVHTIDDSCDGGNSYGVIFNANLEPVGAIQDTDFACFTPAGA